MPVIASVLVACLEQPCSSRLHAYHLLLSSNESRVADDVADLARGLESPGTLVGVGESDVALSATENVQRVAVVVEDLAAEILLLNQFADGELDGLEWAG